MDGLNKFREAYSGLEFRKNGDKVLSILSDYLDKITDENCKTPVMPETDPESLLKKWPDLKLPFINGVDGIGSVLNQLIKESNHLHSPRYIGHQDSSPLPLSVLADMISAFLNNGMTIFEMGQANTIIERKVVEWLIMAVGYTSGAGGFLTSGGSLSNLTALIAARQLKGGGDIWKDGLKGRKLAIISSHYSHYCVRRSSQIMGMGAVGAVICESDGGFYMTEKALKKAYDKAKKEGMEVICVVGSACNTSPGTFEDLNMIADFAQERDIWFHVDGAHGGPTVLSEKYKHLVSGINRADSITYDLHKMMMMPSIATALLFKRNEDSYQAMKQDAPYLYDKNYKEEDDWYNIGKRTMECTKFSMGFKMYLCLAYYGEKFFADYVTTTYDLAREFANLVRKNKSFELGLEPESNIVCFRYVGKECAKKELDDLQVKIRQKVLESGQFYIVQTTLESGIFLRISIMNPLTSKSDFLNLLSLIEGFF